MVSLQTLGDVYWPWLDRAGMRMARRAVAGSDRRRQDPDEMVRRWSRRLWLLAAAEAVGGPVAELPARGAVVWLLYRAGAEFCRSRGVDPTAPAVLRDLRRQVYRGLAGPSPRALGAGVRVVARTRRWVVPAARTWAWLEGASVGWDLYAANQERRRAEAALGALQRWADRVAVTEPPGGAPAPG